MYRKEGLNKMMSLTKISEIMDEWFEMSNTITRDEVFEKEKFDSLWAQTQTIIKEIENKESVSREELALIMELERFIYKEIISDEQLEAGELVWDELDIIRFEY